MPGQEQTAALTDNARLPGARRMPDLLHGHIWNKLLILALPLAASSMLQQLFNAADVAVVGRFVEGAGHARAAMAAVGSNTPIINLLVCFFVGTALGATVLIAQCIGRRDRDGIRKAAHTGVALGVLGGLGMALLGQLIVEPILSVMQVPADVLEPAELYLRIYLCGLPIILLYNFEEAIFRSMGDTRTPLIVLACSGMLNVLLNLFFVLVLKRSVDGVAIATVASNAASAAVLGLLLCRGRGCVKLEWRHLRVDAVSLREILRIGIPAGVQGMVFSISNICVQFAINSLNTVVMAASAAAYNLEVFTYCITSSFGQACTTIVGQNYGANQIRRCHRTLWTSIAFSGVLLGSAAWLMLSCGEEFLSLFNPDAEVVSIGMIRLRYILIAHIFSVFIEAFTGYLRGFGLSLAPALCVLGCVCGTRFFWVYVVFPIYPTFSCIMAVYPVSLGLTALFIIGACLFYQRRMARSPLPVCR